MVHKTLNGGKSKGGKSMNHIHEYHEESNDLENKKRNYDDLENRMEKLEKGMKKLSRELKRMKSLADVIAQRPPNALSSIK